MRDSVSSVINHIKYLCFAKWIPPFNIDDAISELQSNSGWTGPTTSTQTDADSIVSTNPSTPLPSFNIENPPTSTIPQVTVTNANEESSSDSNTDTSDSSLYYDPPHPFLKPGAYHQWSTPPSTPLLETDMQPPHSDHCDKHPGEDWKYNSFLNYDYIHYLVPNPLTGKFVVASYIKIDPFHARPEVSTTFGRPYPVYSCILCPTPVFYNTEVISPHQVHIFHPEESFVPAVDLILKDQCLSDLAASIRQYWYFCTMCKTYPDKATKAKAKEMKYLKRIMEVISNLELADAFNRLVTLVEVTQKTAIPDPEAFWNLKKALEGISGCHCPNSNCYSSSPHLHTLPFFMFALAPCTTTDIISQKHRDAIVWHNALPHSDDRCKFKDCGHQAPARIPSKLTKFMDRQCYKCHSIGHWKKQCPNRDQVPWHLCNCK